MKKIILMLLAAALFLTGCSKTTAGSKQVLCGNSIILSLVRDCGGAGISAVTLIPADVCPGSFDLKPEDAKKIESAALFIIQPFQMPLAEKARKINPNILIEIIKTSDMTIPENYFRGLQEAVSLLGKHFPAMTGQFISNSDSKINEIRNAVINDTEFIQSVRRKNIPVLASTFHVVTSRYLGLDVAGTFEGPESLTPGVMKELMAVAKAKKINLIISNLTGDFDVSAEILNKKLKIKKAVFIVFPAETKGRSMFMNLWEHNLSQLKNIAGQ